MISAINSFSRFNVTINCFYCNKIFWTLSINNSLWTNLENKPLFFQKHLTDFKDSMLTLKAVIAIESSGCYPSSVVFGRIRKIIPFFFNIISIGQLLVFQSYTWLLFFFSLNLSEHYPQSVVFRNVLDLEDFFDAKCNKQLFLNQCNH